MINNLINNRYLSKSSFTLCHKNSLFFYCFTTNENDEIDLSSCYEIKLTKKQQDYSTMNKSGKGKGPFGFDIGMTYEDIKNACGGKEPEHIADDRYYVKPKKSHPLFEKYIVWISDSFGLYYIKGLTYNIHTSNYGTEAKSKFNDLLRTLENKYGKFTLTDTIKKDYYWKDDQYWMESIQAGARTYVATWNVPNDKIYDFDGISWIGLGIECLNNYSTNEAVIWLEYELLNYEDAKEALNDVL